MQLLLAAVGISLFAILCLLSFLDVTPGILWFQIQRRLRKPPCSVHPNLKDAPFRRVFPERRVQHKPILLNLETSEGSGQACHPDAVYIPQGFGMKRWRYWMVCTPYPYSCDIFENPEIFASFDGSLWEIPDGVKNPLVARPVAVGDHNSDPDLLYHDSQLWLYFRETRRGGSTSINRIFLTRSADGIQWTAPMEVLCDQAGTELLSPAVLHDGSCFVMWTVEKMGDEFKIVRRESSDGTKWSSATICPAEGLAEGRSLWHIDVIKEPDRLSALLVSISSTAMAETRIHYGFSLDEGLSWNVGPFLFDRAYEFEAGHQYRGTLLKLSEQPHSYQVWYSAVTRQKAWSIAYLKMVREENNLLPRNW